MAGICQRPVGELPAMRGASFEDHAVDGGGVVPPVTLASGDATRRA
jgi:hypothetical protein